MRLNLNLDYVVDEEDRKQPNFKTNTQVSITLLRTAANAAKNGLKERLAIRTAGKVANAITRAANTKADALDLDELELKSVRDSLKNWMTDTGVPVSLTGWFEELYSAVEKAVEDAEKEKKPESKS